MDLYGSLVDIPHHHPFVAALNAVIPPLETCCSLSLLDDIVGRDELAKDWARAERVLELILYEMRVRRNAVLPVTSRLPPEVLSFVFSYCIDAEPPRASLPQGIVEDYHSNQDIADYEEGTLRWDVQANGQLGWIRLTHVCRSWRTLLCSTSKAWADCLGILPAAIEDTLSRAGSRLPVTFQAIATVACAGSARSLTDIFSLYSLAGSRIAPSRFRAIYILDLRAQPLLAEHSDIDPELSFDNLEHLEVIRVYGEHVSKAPAVFRAPKLQSLKLMPCMLDSSSINLAHLSLNCLGSRGLSLDSLMRSLHRMCNTLRTLELILYHYDLKFVTRNAGFWEIVAMCSDC
ncbi:hypothetical protein PENSPDRAFT_103156 [Peniophora sp. CONT]|nr:hypothetical protein PENSPDRAFT_103156 [Peniophora sp. CONT]